MFGSRIKRPRTESPLKNNQGANLEDCITCSERLLKTLLNVSGVKVVSIVRALR